MNSFVNRILGVLRFPLPKRSKGFAKSLASSTAIPDTPPMAPSTTWPSQTSEPIKVRGD